MLDERHKSKGTGRFRRKGSSMLNYIFTKMKIVLKVNPVRKTETEDFLRNQRQIPCYIPDIRTIQNKRREKLNHMIKEKRAMILMLKAVFENFRTTGHPRNLQS